jgi:SHS family lactate transporter-like MFS transporter
LYPTFLKVQLDFTPGQITFITIIANIGSIIGGSISGYICHFLGRKNAMITFIFLAGCFLPLYVLPRNYIFLTIGAFAVYLCIGVSKEKKIKNKISFIYLITSVVLH